MHDRHDRHDRSAPPSDAVLPPAGTLIDGKWATEGELGRGAVGVVVGARHHVLGQQVAIKFLVNGRDEIARARFFREAKIIASLRSEHVVRVIDFGAVRLPAAGGAGGGEREVEYIVMERLEGESVSAYARRTGVLPAEEAAEIVRQACLAMSEAHARGVVHRDLKPANLFLSRRDDGAPWIRVLDFGVSKLGGAHDNELTSTASVIGSPAYMAPEQIKSSKYVDGRCDLWALGVILHRLLSGELPFSGSTAMAMCAAVIADEPAPLDARLPPGLVAVVARALQKSPDARFRDAREMSEALAPFAGRAARGAHPGGPVAAVGALGDPAVEPRSAPPSIPPPIPAPAPPQAAVDDSVAANVVPVAPARSKASARLALAAVAVIAVGAGAVSLASLHAPGSAAHPDDAAPGPSLSERAGGAIGGASASEIAPRAAILASPSPTTASSAFASAFASASTAAAPLAPPPAPTASPRPAVVPSKTAPIAASTVVPTGSSATNTAPAAPTSSLGKLLDGRG